MPLRHRFTEPAYTLLPKTMSFKQDPEEVLRIREPVYGSKLEPP